MATAEKNASRKEGQEPLAFVEFKRKPMAIYSDYLDGILNLEELE